MKCFLQRISPELVKRFPANGYALRYRDLDLDLRREIEPFPRRARKKLTNSSIGSKRNIAGNLIDHLSAQCRAPDMSRGST